MDFPNLSIPEENQESISFFVEGIDFVFDNDDKLINWLKKIASVEKKRIKDLSYIFCSDDFLHKINVDYLDHDTLTDIITFELGDASDDLVFGEIYISVDRVRENATIHEKSFDDEFRRVVAHGLLHLCGYPDKTESEAKLMRSKEDACLRLYDS